MTQTTNIRKMETMTIRVPKDIEESEIAIANGEGVRISSMEELEELLK